MKALYMYKTVLTFTDMLKMHSQCIIFCPLSLLLSVPAVCYASKNALSFCNLPMQVYIPSHVTCQVSMKGNGQRICFCVGVGREDLGSYGWHTSCHAVGSDQSRMVMVIWSTKWTQAKCGMFLRGYGFQQHNRGHNVSFQSAFLTIILAWKSGIRIDLAKALQLGRKHIW